MAKQALGLPLGFGPVAIADRDDARPAVAIHRDDHLPAAHGFDQLLGMVGLQSNSLGHSKTPAGVGDQTGAKRFLGAPARRHEGEPLRPPPPVTLQHVHARLKSCESFANAAAPYMYGMEMDYHQHAVRCALASFHAKNADDREAYLNMALLWLALAKLQTGRPAPNRLATARPRVH
jgi:hypothetical protein